MNFVLFVMEKIQPGNPFGDVDVEAYRWRALRSFEADADDAKDINGMEPFPVEIHAAGRYMIVPFDEVAIFDAEAGISMALSVTAF